MTDTARAGLVTREAILKLLSNDEVAKVSTAETAPGLRQGEEYLDLEHIDQGVQRATDARKVKMGHLLPRSSVHADTWSKIIGHLRS